MSLFNLSITVWLTVALQHVLKSGIINPPTLVFFKMALAVLGSLHFQINLKISLSTYIFLKLRFLVRFWDGVESTDQFGNNGHPNNLSLLCQEHGVHAC